MASVSVGGGGGGGGNTPVVGIEIKFVGLIILRTWYSLTEDAQRMKGMAKVMSQK